LDIFLLYLFFIKKVKAKIWPFWYDMIILTNKILSNYFINNLKIMAFDTPWENSSTVEKEIKTPEEEIQLDEAWKEQSENLKNVKKYVAEQESKNVDWNEINWSEIPEEMSDEEIENILSPEETNVAYSDREIALWLDKPQEESTEDMDTVDPNFYNHWEENNVTTYTDREVALWLTPSESDLQKIAYFDWMDLSDPEKALLADMYINYVWEDNWMSEQDWKTYDALVEKKWEEFFNKIEQDFDDMDVGLYEESSSEKESTEDMDTIDPDFYKHWRTTEKYNVSESPFNYSESNLKKIKYFDWMDLSNKQKKFLVDMYVNYVWSDHWMGKNEWKIYKWLEQEKWEGFFDKIDQDFDDMN